MNSSTVTNEGVKSRFEDAYAAFLYIVMSFEIIKY